MSEENPYFAARAIDGRAVDAFASFAMGEAPRIGLGIEREEGGPAVTSAVVYLDLEQAAELIRVLRVVRHAAVMETLDRHPREPFWSCVGWTVLQGLAGGLTLGVPLGMFVMGWWAVHRVLGLAP